MKALIDKFYTDNYQQLVDVTRAYINDLKKNIDAEGVVSDAYIYVSQKKGITKEEIGRLTIGFIYRELYLWNSKTNRKGILDSSDDLPKDEVSNQEDRILLFIDVEDFEKTLDRFERNVWEAYYHKGLTTQRELAAHFNIDPVSAWMEIKNLKTKYKKYVETEERL